MSFGKMDKYGVPIDTVEDKRAGLIQPKFNSRFRVFLLDFGTLSTTAAVKDDANVGSERYAIQPNSIITAMAESFTRPALNFNTQETNSFIGRAKYSGRLKHENFTMILRDDITNAVISQIYAQAKKQTYKFHPITQDKKKSPYMGIDTKFKCVLQVMDGRTNHKSLETWTFYGCTIDSIENTPNSYDDGVGISKITLNCSFDYFDISQERRIILHPSFAYEDSSRGQGAPNGGDRAQAEEEGGFFDNISDTASGVLDSGQNLLSNVKDRVSGVFTTEDDVRYIDPNDPSVGNYDGDLWPPA